MAILCTKYDRTRITTTNTELTGLCCPWVIAAWGLVCWYKQTLLNCRVSQQRQHRVVSSIIHRYASLIRPQVSSQLWLFTAARHSMSQGLIRLLTYFLPELGSRRPRLPPERPSVKTRRTFGRFLLRQLAWHQFSTQLASEAPHVSK